jgi:hypothetical protein
VWHLGGRLGPIGRCRGLRSRGEILELDRDAFEGLGLAGVGERGGGGGIADLHFDRLFGFKHPVEHLLGL